MGFLPAATKLGQGNVFTGVCDSVHKGVGVCLSACWDTTPPPQEQTPRSRHPPPKKQTPPKTPPKKQNPPGAEPPPKKQTPPQEAGSGIRSMSGRYASYWNAFLLSMLLVCGLVPIKINGPFTLYVSFRICFFTDRIQCDPSCSVVVAITLCEH